MTSIPEGPGPTRLAVYLVEGRHVTGWRVPAHVLTALRGLRPHVDLLVAGVSSAVSDADRAALGEVADLVVAEAGISHASVVESLLDRVATYEQVLLTGSGWLGPVSDVGALLDRMAGVEVWSLLPKASRPAHDPALRLGPDPDWYVMPGRLAAGEGLRRWRDSGSDADLVDSGRYAFPPDDYPSADPALMNLPALLDDGLPYVPIASLVVDPLVADRLAVVPADGLARLRATGIDMAEVWEALLDAAPLRVLTTNLGLTHVLGSAPADSSATSRLRTAALLHLYYDELTDDLMDRVDLLPGDVHVVVTTTDEQRRASIETRLAARSRQYPHEVRVLASNRGRDIAALLVGCADVLRDTSYDLVVKLHGKRSLQDDVNASAWFMRHLLDNLFPDAAGTMDLYEWFSTDAQLGIAVPPVIHMYYPTMGHAWLGNRGVAESLAERLGVTVPLDDDTPVAPYGSMFVARREALEPWLSLGLTFEDFPDHAAYADGSLAHAIERMFCYVAGGTGRYTGTVLGRRTAGIEYGFLEYKLQAVGSRMPAYAVDQVAFLDAGTASWRTLLQRRLPKLVERLRPLYRRLRSLRPAA